MILLNGKKKFVKTVHFLIENNPIDVFFSNIIIYAAKPEYSELRQFIAQHSPYVSVISYVEVLGYHSLSPYDKAHFEKFFQTSRLLPNSQEILDQAIRLKQQRKILLGDSLIAGTALSHGLTLITHDVSDFKWIDGLTVLDPLSQDEPEPG